MTRQWFREQVAAERRRRAVRQRERKERQARRRAALELATMLTKEALRTPRKPKPPTRPVPSDAAPHKQRPRGRKEREMSRRTKAALQATVRVRILVAVDKDGDWTCHGYHDCKDAMREIFTDTLGVGERYTWVEADVPKPAVDVVEGEVSE